LCEFHSTTATSATSGFRRDVNEFYALLGRYAAKSGNSAPTFRDDLSVPSSRVKQSKEDAFLFDCLNLEDGIYGVSRNIGTELPIYAE